MTMMMVVVVVITTMTMMMVVVTTITMRIASLWESESENISPPATADPVRLPVQTD